MAKILIEHEVTPEEERAHEINGTTLMATSIWLMDMLEQKLASEVAKAKLDK